jgi:hypothetical protein
LLIFELSKDCSQVISGALVIEWKSAI